MDLNKVLENLTAAAAELRGPEEKTNQLNPALGAALTEIVAALRIVKAQIAAQKTQTTADAPATAAAPKTEAKK